MRDIGEAVTLVLVVENAHDVACIAVQVAIEIHLSADVHRVRQELAVDVVGPLRLFALHRQVQVERLGDALLVGQIENLVVRADVQVLIDRGRDIVQCLRSYHAVVLVERQPTRAVLDGVGVVLRTVVVERQFTALTASILDGYIQTVDRPLQTAVGHVVACRLRRSHRVAVQVLDVAQRHVDVAVVQLRVRLVEFHQHLVAASDERELQVGHLLVGHHRCSVLLVEVRQHHILIVHEQVVAHQYVSGLLRLWVELIARLALVIEIEFLAIDIGHQLDAVVLLALLAVEAQVGQQTGLVAVGALRRIGLDELLRQCLSKEQQFVDVTLQRSLSVLSQQGVLLVDDVVAAGTDERIAAADAAKAVGFEGGNELLVHVDVGHAAAAVHGHGVVVPLAVAPVAWNVGYKAVGAVLQRVGLEADVELVHSAVVLLQSATIGEQRAASVLIGLKPEHQRVVLLGGAVHGVLIQEHTLVGLIDM